ncbi:ankyrin [Coprinopsis marcescibilis]|uniref:Ankyrin n=1 Tax=Coprinopsis marcescibilis TaxID=230819 RepID=A0A5C3KW56_COPMA|nr:ankyrin [Coprinopsis marcescibilis]
MVKLLLEFGADINKHANYSECWLFGSSKVAPLHFVCGQYGRLELVNLLLDNDANINQDSDEGSPLQVACAKYQFEVVQLLVERGAKVKQDRGALKAACTTSQSFMVEYLLKHGADPNIRDKAGLTLLREMQNIERDWVPKEGSGSGEATIVCEESVIIKLLAQYSVPREGKRG